LSDRLKELQMNGIVGKDFVKENNVLKTSYHLEDKGKNFMNIKHVYMNLILSDNQLGLSPRMVVSLKTSHYIEIGHGLPTN